MKKLKIGKIRHLFSVAAVAFFMAFTVSCEKTDKAGRGQSCLHYRYSRRVCFYSHISGRTLRAGDRHGTLNLGTPGSPRLNMRSYITLRNNRLVKHWQKTTVPEKVHLDLFWCSNFFAVRGKVLRFRGKTVHFPGKDVRGMPTEWP